MHSVSVVLADAGQIAEYAEEILPFIPQYYANGYQRIRRKQEAQQELASGFLLSQYLGVSRDEQLVRTAHGKPSLRPGGKHFNLSHSGRYAALAIADMDIGLDIEQIRAVHWPTVRKVFSRRQQELLARTPEAELKLLGTGFAVDLEPGYARNVRSVRSGDYVVTCAANERFDLTLEYAVWTERRKSGSMNESVNGE